MKIIMKQMKEHVFFITKTIGGFEIELSNKEIKYTHKVSKIELLNILDSAACVPIENGYIIWEQSVEDENGNTVDNYYPMELTEYLEHHMSIGAIENIIQYLFKKLSQKFS